MTVLSPTRSRTLGMVAVVSASSTFRSLMVRVVTLTTTTVDRTAAVSAWPRSFLTRGQR